MPEDSIKASSNYPQLDFVVREIPARGFDAVIEELRAAQRAKSTIAPEEAVLLRCLELERQNLDTFYLASHPDHDDGLLLVQHLRERAHHSGYDALRNDLDRWLAASGHLYFKSSDAWRSPAPAALIAHINVGVNVSPGLPVAFSRDGSRIISVPTPVIDAVGVHKLIQLWDAYTGKLIHQFDKMDVRNIAISNDGRLAVFGGMTLELWNLDSATLIRQFEGHTKAISNVAYSLDGTRIASNSDDGTLRVWDVGSGKELCQIDINKTGRNGSLALSRDGRRVCRGSNIVQVWNVESKEELFIHDYSRGYFPAYISADGRRIAVGLSNGPIHIYDIETGAAGGEPRVLSGHTDAVFSLSFSEDRTRLLSGARDGTVRLWSVDSGETFHLYHNGSPAYTASFANDGRVVVVSGNLLKIWDFTAEGETKPPPVQVGTHLAISADGNWIVSGYDQVLYGWNTLTGAKVYDVDFVYLTRTPEITPPKVPANPNPEDRKRSMSYISSIDISQDGTRLLTGSGDRVMRLWDLQRGTEVRRWVSAGLRAVLSPDGRWAAALVGSQIKIWNTNSEAEPLTWQATTTSLVDLVFSRDGNLLLSGAASPSPAAVRGEWEVIYDDSLRLWDATTGAELRRINVDSWQNELSFLDLSPSGHLALSAAKDKQVRLWDLRTGQELRRFTGHTDDVTAVLFSPDERWALSAGKDRTVRVWDVQTGEQLAVLNVDQPPRQLALSATNPPILAIGAGSLYVMSVISSGRFDANSN